MKKFLSILPRWLPALLVMLIIFWFSSQPDGSLPDFNNFEYLVKKSAHMIVYGILSLSYLYAFSNRNYKLSWLLAVIYAVTDEYHQSFVMGRTSSVTDVLIFDNIGALLALSLHYWRYKDEA